MLKINWRETNFGITAGLSSRLLVTIRKKETTIPFQKIYCTAVLLEPLHNNYLSLEYRSLQHTKALMLNDAPSKWITNRRALCKLQTALAASRRRRARSKMIMKDLFPPVNQLDFFFVLMGSSQRRLYLFTYLARFQLGIIRRYCY